VQIAYTNPKIATVALGIQAVGLQFNDDLNTQFIPAATLAAAGYDPVAAGLPGYTVVDLSVARDICRNIQAFVGAQNLFDVDYFVQTNPSTVGTPRLVNVGIRVRLAGR
jgi:outer membrane receptor protein involved in Fe transport